MNQFSKLNLPGLYVKINDLYFVTFNEKQNPKNYFPKVYYYCGKNHRIFKQNFLTLNIPVNIRTHFNKNLIWKNMEQ